MIDIWRKKFILSDSDQPTTIDDIRPIEADHDVLDPKTFEGIEAAALFGVVDNTQTEAGYLTLYRSIARPVQDAQTLQQKQVALREIESNPELYSGGLLNAQACSDPPPDTSNLDPNHGLIIGDTNAEIAACVINNFAKSNTGRNEMTVTLPGRSIAVKASGALTEWVRVAVRTPNAPLTNLEVKGGAPVGDTHPGTGVLPTGRLPELPRRQSVDLLDPRLRAAA